MTLEHGGISEARANGYAIGIAARIPQARKGPSQTQHALILAYRYAEVATKLEDELRPADTNFSTQIVDADPASENVSAGPLTPRSRRAMGVRLRISEGTHTSNA
jgi:hypothetical protein